MTRNPMPVMADSLTVDSVYSIKRADCTFYNSCLDQAITGDWENFGCGECTAYCAAEREQAWSDVIALLAVDKAAEQLATLGKIDRRRGVKPGADAKVRSRKPQLVNREEMADGTVVVSLAVVA